MGVTRTCRDNVAQTVEGGAGGPEPSINWLGGRVQPRSAVRQPQRVPRRSLPERLSTARVGSIYGSAATHGAFGDPLEQMLATVTGEETAVAVRPAQLRPGQRLDGRAGGVAREALTASDDLTPPIPLRIRGEFQTGIDREFIPPSTADPCLLAATPIHNPRVAGRLRCSVRGFPSRQCTCRIADS